MIRHAALLATMALAVLLLAASSASAEAENCATDPRPECFGIESVSVSPSTTQAGAHPDLEFDVAVKQNPSSAKNVFELHNSYAAARDIRFVVPPGLIGDPNVIGSVQQCSAQQLVTYNQLGGGCPNGSQIGVSDIYAYELLNKFHEPVYMMQPPGGDVAARVGLIAGIYPMFLDFRVRSDSDYSLVSEVVNAPAAARLVKLETSLWGVPAASVHDTERCTAKEVLSVNCTSSPSRPPGGNELPFFTNPTRCGVTLKAAVNASSWVDPEMKPENEVFATFPPITGCDKLPFGPALDVQPTTHHTASPSGLDMTIKLPASPGVKVLEPSQTRYMRIDLPPGLTVNPTTADGLQVCSPEQVHFHENVDSDCPNGSKIGATEFDIPVLERKLKGGIFLRKPEPGHPYLIWIVADDLGLHVKLPGDLELDQKTGQIHSVIVGTPETEGLPQAPLREVKLLLKSGFRAPMITPERCGTYYTHFEFTPWSGGPPAVGNSPMEITEGCATGDFKPKLSAGSADAQGGAFSPFSVAITREDGEQNISGLNLTLPTGLAASFAGIPRCEGQAAITGQCPAASRLGKVIAAVGPGPNPLWVPQPGKRPANVYLGGPYKGAPTSVVAVVPKQAGPFDFGDEIVRSAVFIDPVTAQATAKADPFPQIAEGIPLAYRTLSVQLDRPGFTLNPTSCKRKEAVAALTSNLGNSATATSTYAAIDCGALGFKPNFSLSLKGGTKRGRFPALRASFRPRAGDANASSVVVRLPHSAFLEQGHFRTICTRVQYNANGGGGAGCPSASIYGRVVAKTPILDAPLEGPVYLRSSNHNLPDMVLSLHGPPSLPIQVESVGRIDSAKGGIRSSFEAIPDAPISEVRLEMEGGQKGLIVNSTNICASVNRAEVKLSAQNGKAATLKPPVVGQCKGARKGKRHGKRTSAPGR